MTWRKIVLRFLLVVVLVFDLIVGLEAYRHGWPGDIQGRSLGNGRMQVTVAKLSMSLVDWLVLVGLAVVQAVVFYANWRFARLARGRTSSLS